jgi:DNA-binding LacI/PurR family transcriptional regulator
LEYPFPIKRPRKDPVGPVATMSDVADRAGVSRSTVSYALSGIRPISDETRRRIADAMHDLGYSPNALARALASRRSGIIAMLYPLLERGVNLSGLDHIWAAADEARSAGYNMLLWPVAAEDIDELQHLTQQGLVEGVLLMEVRQNDPRVRYLLEAEIPFSEIGISGIEGDAPYVDTDFEQTAHGSLAYLGSLGHTSIAFVNHPRSTIESGYGPAVRAQRAAEAAAEDLGLTLFSLACQPKFRAGREAFSALIVEQPDVTAVVSINEQALVGVLGAAGERGLHVPRDLSVMSLLSSAGTAEMTVPSLTTMSPPAYELGRKAMSSLLTALESGTRSGSQTLVPSVLTIRESTGPRRALE